MIQKDLLQFNTVKTGNCLVPRWFDERDYHWLHPFLDECRRFSGKPLREFRQRLAEPFPFSCPAYKLRLAAKVLAQNYFKLQAKISRFDAICLREMVFSAGAIQRSNQQPGDNPSPVAPTVTRDEILEAVGLKTGYNALQILDLMFADLPDERLISELPENLLISELALIINFELVRMLLVNAQVVDVLVSGQSRAFIRQAKLTGLICEVEREERAGVIYGRVRISGPLAILRRTRIYARSLGNLFPFLARCPRFEARALLSTSQGETELILRSGDPFLPHIPLKEFDSKVEREFATDFLKQAPSWDLTREPRPIVCGKSVIFPDFALVQRITGESYLLEIIGFWTEAYLNKKLDMLAKARIENLIICIDKNLNCADTRFPDFARIITYSRKIRVKDVLTLIEGDQGRFMLKAARAPLPAPPATEAL